MHLQITLSRKEAPGERGSAQGSEEGVIPSGWEKSGQASWRRWQCPAGFVAEMGGHSKQRGQRLVL